METKHNNIVQIPKLDYRVLNVVGPWVLLAVFSTTATYGVLVAMPALYTDQVWLRTMQASACFCFVQLIAHWITTRTSHSVYKSDIVSLNEQLATYSQASLIHTEPKQRNVTSVSSAALVKSKTNGLNCVADKKKYASGLSSNCLKDSELYREKVRHQEIGTPKTKMPDGSDISKENSKQQASQDRSKIYWCWKHCFKCQSLAPPRCHHCSLCGVCVLKRNHHCFLTGVCIGSNNHRYFLVFISWAVVTVTFGLVHMYLYIYHELLSVISLVDFFPAVCLIRGLTGKVPLNMFVLSITFWGLHLFSVFSYIMFVDIVRTTYDGRTKHEIEKCIGISDSRSLRVRLRDILGENWAFNFVIPFARRTLQKEDAVNWPMIGINPKNRQAKDRKLKRR